MHTKLFCNHIKNITCNGDYVKLSYIAGLPHTQDIQDNSGYFEFF